MADNTITLGPKVADDTLQYEVDKNVLELLISDVVKMILTRTAKSITNEEQILLHLNMIDCKFYAEPPQKGLHVILIKPKSFHCSIQRYAFERISRSRATISATTTEIYGLVFPTPKFFESQEVEGTASVSTESSSKTRQKVKREATHTGIETTIKVCTNREIRRPG